jgi:hypothetical protein
MTHISGITAGIYSTLCIHRPATELTASGIAALDTAAEFEALFATEIENIGGTKAAGTFVRFKNVREFPQIGTPANIVNVPVYGQSTSTQVQGQSDAPDLSLTLNFVPADFDPTALLGGAVGDGIQRVFRFSFLGSKPTSYASTSLGIGQVQNSSFYWIGKIESLLTSPQLTDANQATLALSVQSQFFGAYTMASS